MQIRLIGPYIPINVKRICLENQRTAAPFTLFQALKQTYHRILLFNG